MVKIKVNKFPEEAGYRLTLEKNLITRLTKDQIADFMRGQGGELRWKMEPHFDKGYISIGYPKMCAECSSSALVVNAFAQAAANKEGVDFWNRVFGMDGYLSGEIDVSCFEKQLRIDGVCGWPPNLDFFVRAGSNVIAVESKYKEPCNRRQHSKIQDQYFQSFSFHDSDSCVGILQVAQDILNKSNGMGFTYLDAAQLIKHLLALESLVLRPRSRIKNYALVYLYHPVSDEETRGVHLDEVRRFDSRMKELGVPFKFMTYRDVVMNMSKISSEHAHVEMFKQRYSDIKF